MNWNPKNWNWIKIRNEALVCACILAFGVVMMMLWAAQDLPSDQIYFSMTDDSGQGWRFSGQDAQYHTTLHFTALEGMATIKNYQDDKHYLIVNGSRVDSARVLPGEHVHTVEVFAIDGQHILTATVHVHMANQS